MRSIKQAHQMITRRVDEDVWQLKRGARMCVGVLWESWDKKEKAADGGAERSALVGPIPICVEIP